MRLLMLNIACKGSSSGSMAWYIYRLGVKQKDCVKQRNID